MMRMPITTLNYKSQDSRFTFSGGKRDDGKIRFKKKEKKYHKTLIDNQNGEQFSSSEKRYVTTFLFNKLRNRHFGFEHFYSNDKNS